MAGERHGRGMLCVNPPQSDYGNALPFYFYEFIVFEIGKYQEKTLKYCNQTQ